MVTYKQIMTNATFFHPEAQGGPKGCLKVGERPKAPPPPGNPPPKRNFPQKFLINIYLYEQTSPLNGTIKFLEKKFINIL